MGFSLGQILDEYPNPVYIIRPMLEDGVCRDFTYLYVNEAFCLFIGLSREELENHRFLEIFENGEQSWLDLFAATAVEKKHTYVEDVSTVVGKRLYNETFHVEPDICGCIIHDFADISGEVGRKDEELRHRANYDYLTGFYNRFYLKERMDEISRSEHVGIAFVDINNLKICNDTLGHAAGDDLIREVAGLIRQAYGDSMVFRIGGDEFVVITVGEDRETFMGMSQRAVELFRDKNLAALGCRYYDRLDNLYECIDECDNMMYKNKKEMKKTE